MGTLPLLRILKERLGRFAPVSGSMSFSLRFLVYYKLCAMQIVAKGDNIKRHCDGYCIRKDKDRQTMLKRSRLRLTVIPKYPRPHP